MYFLSCRHFQKFADMRNLWLRKCCDIPIDRDDGGQTTTLWRRYILPAWPLPTCIMFYTLTGAVWPMISTCCEVELSLSCQEMRSHCWQSKYFIHHFLSIFQTQSSNHDGTLTTKHGVTLCIVHQCCCGHGHHNLSWGLVWKIDKDQTRPVPFFTVIRFGLENRKTQTKPITVSPSCTQF